MLHGANVAYVDCCNRLVFDQEDHFGVADAKEVDPGDCSENKPSKKTISSKLRPAANRTIKASFTVYLRLFSLYAVTFTLSLIVKYLH